MTKSEECPGAWEPFPDRRADGCPWGCWVGIDAARVAAGCAVAFKRGRRSSILKF